MKYLMIFIAGICIISSCSKEKYTSYIATWNNKSTHFITIFTYKNGTVDSSKIVYLKPDTSFIIANGGNRGIGDGASGFYSEQISGDSMKVIFDNLYGITHYLKLPINTTVKYYAYTSIRNLMNLNSYAFKQENKSNTYQLENYDYTFTEQDYLDAK